jgi:hypothetical protein
MFCSHVFIDTQDPSLYTPAELTVTLQETLRMERRVFVRLPAVENHNSGDTMPSLAVTRYWKGFIHA